MNDRVGAFIWILLISLLAPIRAHAQGLLGAFGLRGRGGVAPQELKLVEQFDADGDHRLNTAERQAARDYLNSSGLIRRGRGGIGVGAGVLAGPKLSPEEVKPLVGKPVYDPFSLRTYFFQFPDEDWEAEMADFHRTDIEIPADLIVDGKSYPDSGVNFRGNSSFSMVRAGYKRSLNVKIDFVHKDQNIEGVRSLNFLNSHEDPTFLRSLLYLKIYRDYIPAPDANLVKVVINGESWGIYVNQEQTSKEFAEKWFQGKKVARWKVEGNHTGDTGLIYLGNNVTEYSRRFEIKSKDDPQDWSALMNLCDVLNHTPAAKLKAALEPILDIDGALKFLALDNAMINGDGYWIKQSDYSLVKDEAGRFHLIPHDCNEGLNVVPNRRGFGVELDPLISANDPTAPLASRLLAVPELKKRYFGFLRQIAQDSFDWAKLKPVVEKYHALIAADVARDTKKLDSTDAFNRSMTEDVSAKDLGTVSISLKHFFDQRRAFLLSYLTTVDPR